MTAARCTSRRDSGGRRSMRAAMSACSVSGMRCCIPSGCSASARIVSSTNSGFPSAFARTASTSIATSSSAASALDELRALVVGESLELERDGAQPAPTPRRARVEQLGPGEAEKKDRRGSHPGRDVLDHLEQRLLGPVDVLEDEDERLHGGELLDPRADGPRDVLLAPLALDRLEDADREPEQVGDRLALARLAELLERLLERVVVGDPGRGLHHLGDRPVRHAFAVRQAAAAEDGGVLEPVDELSRQPALTDSGLPVERDEAGPPVARGARERVLEQLELGLAPDERRRERAHRATRLPGADDATRRDRLAPATQLERLELLELDEVPDEPRRGRADHDLVRPGLLLEAGGEVDRRAGGERGVGLVGDDLARLDADPHVEAELADAIERRERRADGALGVVLVL